MSMPCINPTDTTRYQAITDIIESVALEQTALSHILNAEGEKLQKVISICNVNAEELLEINESIRKTINSITKLEMILQFKLELFSNENSCEECVDFKCRQSK